MKIGIVTFHRACNFGAVLQTYALQTAVRRISKEKVVVVDYKMEKNDEMYSPFYKREIAALKKPMYDMVRYWKIQSFIKRRLRCTSKVESFDRFASLFQEIEVGIWGSDQIWNRHLITKEDEKYYFGEVPCRKKIAYAVSVGESKAKELVSRCEAMKEFDYISVRDDASGNLIKEITGRTDVVTVLDPTLLLSKKSWEKLIKKENSPENKYMLYYEVKLDDGYKVAKALAEKFGLPLKVISYQKYYFEKRNSHCIGAGPQDFLSLLYHAEVVCTNSFHGVAFSINFNKPFYCIDYDKRKGDLRKQDLLRDCHLLDRVITMKDVRNLKDDYRVNFEYANQYIRNKRKESIRFIKTALGNN